ncbi:ATP synthase epsilon chain [compost metagenome]
MYGVQLPGVEGSFEILENHAAMVAALGEGKMKILKDKTNTELYTIKGGFVEVLNNKATVLLEGAATA